MEQRQAVDDSERRLRAESGSRGVLVFVPEADSETRFTWRPMRDAARRDRWIHAVILLVCVALACAYAFLTTPVYRAQVVLLPVSGSEQSGLLSGLQGSGLEGLAGLAGINLDSTDDFRKESLALLTSRDFTIRFIEAESLLPLLFPKKWDPERGAWRSDDPEYVPTIDQALERFDRSVRTVTEDRRNGLTLVSMEWPDRVLAASWANAYVARANAELRRRTIEDAQRSLEFLRRELAKTSVTGLQQTLYRLMEKELRKATLASVREQYAFRIVDSARVPMTNRPVRPKRALSLLTGLAFALLASSWILWLRARQVADAGQGR